MLSRLHELSERRENFAFESTWPRAHTHLGLAGCANRVTRYICSSCGCEVSIWQLNEWLSVRRGGHHIPSQELRRRYQRGIDNLFELYIPLADTWAIYDNSEQEHAALIATGVRKRRPRVSRPDLWQVLLESRT